MEPASYQPKARYRLPTDCVRVARPQWTDRTRSYRLSFSALEHPLRGFRAPILQEAEEFRMVAWPPSGAMEQWLQTHDLVLSMPRALTPEQSQAVRLIEEKLGSEGILATLSRCLELMGPQRFLSPRQADLSELWNLGFPVDLLGFFRLHPTQAAEPAEVIAGLAQKLARGQTTDQLRPWLQAAAFAFQKTHPHFCIAEESGAHEIGLLRLQIGGGYRNGIIRGSSIDVTGQLLAAFPNANVLATVPEDYLENMRWMGLHIWPLKHRGQLTLIPERLPVAPWAQDNGKAGYLAELSPAFGSPATLVPRYASQKEVETAFVPGESFLMDGVQASGHRVLHSPLLFQGGNLLVAHDPNQDKRVLLLSETELYRNMELGLTWSQVLEAFTIEMAVDQCVVMPAVSYHLDYDVTLREHGGGIIAFMNDPDAAARLVLEQALKAFRRGGMLSNEETRKAADQLAQGDVASVLDQVTALILPFRTGQSGYRASLVRLFASGQTDSPVYNFQCFMAARDILACTTAKTTDVPSNPETLEYYASLRNLLAATKAQQDTIRKQGWRIVLVPSMPDLYCSVNYLNGLQDRSAYVMPVLGGFYTPVDRAAAQVFQNTLGNGLRIVSLYSQNIQANHGGLHCVAATYPIQGPHYYTSQSSPGPSARKTANFHGLH